MTAKIATICGALLLAGTGIASAIPGPAIDWDPAFTWEPGATATNSIAGNEFHMVGVISDFNAPFDDLDASDPTKEYTFYAHGLISNGTVPSGPPLTTLYTTNYSFGTIEIYEDTSPDQSFDPFPPNAGVPGDFTDGTLILSGAFTSFVVQSNNFTTYQTGNIEGEINWSGGTLYDRTLLGDIPCPGLLTGGSTWNPAVLIPGYIYRHDGKIDLQCPTPTRATTWGRVKSLYR